MQSVQVLRLNRTDEQSASVLLHISSGGSKVLDLKLVATEQEHIYHASVRQSKVKTLSAKTYNGSDDDWHAILEYILLRKRPEDSRTDTLQGVEAVASVSGTDITVTIRRNIGGVTQRLGSIKLEQDDEREEISFPDWVDAAARSTEEFQQELERTQALMQSQKEQITRLQLQLDELVVFKRQHEDELMQKFAALLNSKKLKIRDQQRLLATAKLDPNTAATIGSARSSTNSKKNVNTTRESKRQRVQTPAVPQDDEMDEEMDEGTESDEDDVNASKETPDPSDDDDDGGLHSNAATDDQIDHDDAADAATFDPNRMSDVEPINSRQHGSLVSGREKAGPSTQSQPGIHQSSVPDDDDDDETDDEL